MITRLVCLVLVFYGISNIAYAQSRNHVRVVLDLSQSMRSGKHGEVGNDPGGMAILSTILLYDLAHPDIGTGDSFKVIPFDLSWRWTNLNQPPRQDPKSVIEAGDRGGRQAFIQSVKSRAYDAECTYFYPGLKFAVDDLESIGHIEDTRTIVLITDGLPDDPCHKSGIKTQDHEKRLIEQLVDQRMKPKQIRLYVLPFGPQVNQSFFAKMAIDSGGQVFFKPGRGLKGEYLLEDMLCLFANSLGYEVDGPYAPLSNELELRKEAGVAEAAVVVFNPKPANAAASIPSIARLEQPRGANAINLYQNAPLGEIAPSIAKIADSRSGEPGAAYSLAWVLNAGQGKYPFEVRLDAGQLIQIAVLRRVTAELKFIDKIDPSRPLPTVVDAMANEDLPLLVELTNRGGGDPGKDTAVQFKLSSQSNPHDAPAIRPNDYRLRKITEKFSQNSADPSSSYRATIEAQAYRNGRPLGNRVTQHVNVHPFLSMTPHPTSGNAGSALKKGQRTCQGGQFTFDVQGHLPNPIGASIQYTIKASLDFPDEKAIANEFNGASLTLDAKELQFDNPRSPVSPAYFMGPSAGEWFQGRNQNRQELLSGHQLCIATGSPKSANPSKNMDLRVHFVLKQPPYDDFDVIQPFIYRLNLAEVQAPPPPDLAWLLLPGLALLYFLWHLRGQPKLPNDLAYSFAHGLHATALTPRELGAPSILRRVLALLPEKPIIAENGEEPLAWVRPSDAELYSLRLATGVGITARDDAKPPELKGDLASIRVHRIYRLSRGNRAYLLRLEYRT